MLQASLPLNPGGGIRRQEEEGEESEEEPAALQLGAFSKSGGGSSMAVRAAAARRASLSASKLLGAGRLQLSEEAAAQVRQAQHWRLRSSQALGRRGSTQEQHG